MALSPDRVARKQADELRRRHPPKQPERPEPVAAQPPARPPSPRELEVLQRVANGYTSSEIGRQMYVSHETVKSHLRRLYANAGLPRSVVNKRAALVAWALRRGYIT